MASSSKISLKLLIDKKGKRVLFAEAGKDFVDFLFSLLTLPIGTILSLVGNTQMAGGLPKLYQSVSDLDHEYIKSGRKKDALLKPTTPSLPFGPPQIPILPIKEWSLSSAANTPNVAAIDLYKCGYLYCTFGMLSATYGSRCSCGRSMNTLLSATNPTGTSATTLYKCGSCLNSSSLSTTYDSKCTNRTRQYGSMMKCLGKMTIAVTDYVSKSQVDKQGGFVKESITYLVADDLSVSPMSTILNISLLNKFNIKDLGALEEKVVQIGMDEGLELLRYSMNSKTILTNVFLKEVEVKVKVEAKVKEEILDLDSDSDNTTTRKRTRRGAPCGR